MLLDYTYALICPCVYVCVWSKGRISGFRNYHLRHGEAEEGEGEGVGGRDGGLSGGRFEG